MTAYYNELDPYPAQWMRNLIDAGHIASGTVDERSIANVRPEDVSDYTQAHFFAGLGGWSYALRLAGWPDKGPRCWTGSCPCQPFSTAGRAKGFADERHLWPAWFKLIRKCQPRIIFGEQVGSPDGLRWLDLVRSDLAREGYAVGVADLCAACVGAPHIRQRLYFVAISSEQRREGERVRVHVRARQSRSPKPEAPRGGSARELGHARSSRSPVGPRPEERFGAIRVEGASATAPGATSGFWADAEWWLCRDGKARPAQPKIFPLADGVPARVGKLRAAGNAIVPQVAAAFIRAVMPLIGLKPTG